MSKQLFFSIIISVILVACNSDSKVSDNRVYSYDCVVVNMGNYSETNGSIALFDSSNGTIHQEVFSQANGRKLSSIIESAVLHNDLLVLLCNNADKVVFLDAHTMKEVCAPIEHEGAPRYAAVNGDYIYVSCWGTNQILKINLTSKSIEKRLTPTGKVEGLLVKDGILYAASESGLDIFENDILKMHLASNYPNMEAQQLVVDKNNVLWLSLGNFSLNSYSGAFMCVNINTLEIVSQFKEEKLSVEGDMALSPAKDKIYFIHPNDIVGGNNMEAATDIYSIDVDTKQLSTDALIKGKGFYGLGVNPISGDILTANVYGFMTNSMMYEYSVSGKLKNSLKVGVGASRFVFR